MLTVPTVAQMREADRYSINNEPISSVDLMERAAMAFVKAFATLYPDKDTHLLVCCGTGNNGGDGLAVARLLYERGYQYVHAGIVRFSDHASSDFTINLERLRKTPVQIQEWSPEEKIHLPGKQVVLIDALLGSGLNKQLEGSWLGLIQQLNELSRAVVAVDIPTGLMADGIINPQAAVLKADHVITFQCPKISFFFPESAAALEEFHVVDIGLDPDFLEQQRSGFCLLQEKDIRAIIRKRTKFGHKGTYGHALLLAGEENTMGAALLTAAASLYTGSGLTSVCIPASGLTALNTAYPEIMYTPEEELSKSLPLCNAIGIGPGLGRRSHLLEDVLSLPAPCMVLDADALNYLSGMPDLLDTLPPGTILTPHVKEFDRLFGIHTSWMDRIISARHWARTKGWIILLKNRYTFVNLPDGNTLINPTGNPAMATGGMGDVLTGMITAFLAQGYTPENSAIAAVYLHGLAGDQLRAGGQAIVFPSQVVRCIPGLLCRITESPDTACNP